MTNFQLVDQEPVAESPFGPPCEPARAPETISRAVASLPPEQMFQLMQQMKLCIQNNPSEARTMLMQIPQLAYALLQAQVVMRIVDPETAVQMLHKTVVSSLREVIAAGRRDVAEAIAEHLGCFRCTRVDIPVTEVLVRAGGKSDL